MSDWLNSLSLAIKAQKVVSGDQVLKAVRNNSAKLILIASDASDNTKKKYCDKAKFYHVDYLIVANSTAISKAIGKHQRMYVAIVDEGFAKMIKDKLKEE